MIKEMNAMEELKDIMLNGDKFENNDFYPNVDVSDGSSYDGFINFTDGFVTVSANYTPHMDSELTFNGGDNEEQKNRAKNAQLILDEMLSPALYDFYDWNIKGKDDNEWFKEFPTFDEFKDWYDIPSDQVYFWFGLRMTDSLLPWSETCTEPERRMTSALFKEG